MEVVEKKPEFDTQKIREGIVHAMGAWPSNHPPRREGQTEQAAYEEARTVILGDPEKCRQMVLKVQGEEAGKRTDPVYMARYQKRAERMFAQYMAIAFSVASTVVLGQDDAGSEEVKGTSTGESAGSANPGGAPEQQKQQEKTMAKAKKTTKKDKTPKAPKGPGVIDTIVSVLSNGKHTVAEIAERVAKKFPDRDADGLKATVKIQVNRLKQPKDAGGRSLKIKTEKQEGTNELKYYI